uniref:Uncharacterized protein n=1 Tax=Hippocampus comes TaxID=109280 RepID=A0A3Q2XWZ2_HIPCM
MLLPPATSSVERSQDFPSRVIQAAAGREQLTELLKITFIHHLSTKERRIRAIREMARTLRAGGRVMIYVWAMEQKRRKFEKQDIFVPWNPNPRSPDVGPPSPPPGRATAQSAGDDGDKHRKVRSTSSVADGAPHRLWFFSPCPSPARRPGSSAVYRAARRARGARDGPSSSTSPASFLRLPRSGPRRTSSAPAPICTRSPKMSKRSRSGRESAATDGSCLRYYHVFREGELAQLIADHVAQLRVRHAYFDHANWCVVAEKVEPGKI